MSELVAHFLALGFAFVVSFGFFWLPRPFPASTFFPPFAAAFLFFFPATAVALRERGRFFVVPVTGLGAWLLGLWPELLLDLPVFDVLAVLVAALFGFLVLRRDWLRLREVSRLSPAFMECSVVLSLAGRLGLRLEARTFGVLPALAPVF